MLNISARWPRSRLSGTEFFERRYLGYGGTLGDERRDRGGRQVEGSDGSIIPSYTLNTIFARVSALWTTEIFLFLILSDSCL